MAEEGSESIVRTRVRFFAWRAKNVSVNQQPYGSALVVAALMPMAAPEPPKPKIELGIRFFCSAL